MASLSVNLEKCDDKAYSARNPFVRRYFWSRLIAIVQVADSCSPELVLDVGCGRGELHGILAEKFANSELVAIDLGKDVYVAGREAKASGIHRLHLVRADARFLPIRSASSQLVVCASMLEHLANALPAVLEMRRVLEPGARLVVGLPTENRLYRLARKLVGFRKPVDHYHEVSHVVALVRNHFAFLMSRKLPLSILPGVFALYVVSVYENSRRLG